MFLQITCSIFKGFRIFKGYKWYIIMYIINNGNFIQVSNVFSTVVLIWDTVQIEHKLLRIPTGERLASWLFICVS